MLTVGLTGGIGSGKTCVSDIFKDLGVPVIDTDEISRDLVNHDQSVQKEITNIFGDGIISDDNSINRKRLAQIIFNDKDARIELEKVLHPKIRAAVKSRLQKYASCDSPPKYVLVVIPLLFETNFRDFINRILVVTADKNTRIERIKLRDNRSTDDIQSIIANQVTDQKRIAGADEIIKNDGNFAELTLEVDKLHKKYSNVHISPSQNT